jgi:dipeptidyl aminopeptidase/acylaminoacyl peptidase
MPARSSKRRPITPKDLLRFQWLSGPRLSPDGSLVAFVKKHVSERNDYVTEVWVVAAEGGRPRRFTAGPRDAAPAWSPDGRQIAFVRAESKSAPQLFLIDAGGGEARQLTSFPEGTVGAFRWAPDGGSIAVAFRQRADTWTEAAKEEREAAGLSTPPRVVDDWWYRYDGDGYFDADRFALYLVDVGSGKHRSLYKADTLGGFSFDFSPDSRRLVVSTNRARKALVEPWRDELLLIETKTAKSRPIPGLPQGPKTAVRWSPDGRHIAYAGREGDEGSYSVENLELWVCDPRRGQARSLTARTDECLLAACVSDASELDFAPAFEFTPDSSRLLVRLGTRGQTHLASVTVRGGRMRVLTRGPIDLDLGNVADDGRVALLVGKATQLNEVAVVRLQAGSAEIRRLTRFNSGLLRELDLVRPKSVWIKATDGHPIHLWYLRPNVRRRRLPAVLEVHGGPHAQYGSGFFHEFQVLAAQGYAVFYSNPRGSKGYGRDHCAAIRGAWGTADWTDIQAVTEYIKQQPFVDPDRVGIMGGSYGGYMTNWAIGHSRAYRAAITDRCVSNLVSMGGTSDYVIEPDGYFPGNSWDRPEPRWEQSPLKYLGKAKTPTLIIHSEGDLRCNIEQSEQVFAALKLLNVPTRFVRYPASTSHGLSRGGPPDLRLHRLHQILEWWKRYL